jgi:hypothetical protein
MVFSQIFYALRGRMLSGKGEKNGDSQKTTLF